jgi:hypothetical protein
MKKLLVTILTMMLFTALGAVSAFAAQHEFFIEINQAYTLFDEEEIDANNFRTVSGSNIFVHNSQFGVGTVRGTLHWTATVDGNNQVRSINSTIVENWSWTGRYGAAGNSSVSFSINGMQVTFNVSFDAFVIQSGLWARPTVTVHVVPGRVGGFDIAETN